MDNDMPVTDGTDGEARRRDLELRKLDIEIAQLRLPWWKKPAYLGSILPVAVAILTLVGAVFTGYFSAERARLKADRVRLENDIQTIRSIGAELTEHFSKTLKDLKNISDQKSKELKKILDLINSGDVQQIKQAVGNIRREIQKITDHVEKGNNMLNALPKFGQDTSQ